MKTSETTNFPERTLGSGIKPWALRCLDSKSSSNRILVFKKCVPDALLLARISNLQTAKRFKVESRLAMFPLKIIKWLDSSILASVEPLALSTF